jgi:hypothetical protein
VFLSTPELGIDAGEIEGHGTWMLTHGVGQ